MMAPLTMISLCMFFYSTGDWHESYEFLYATNWQEIPINESCLDADGNSKGVTLQMYCAWNPLELVDYRRSGVNKYLCFEALFIS